jgi:integrase/recombinase XerD
MGAAGEQRVEGTDPGRGTLEPLAEEYLTWLAVDRGRSRATVEAYRRDLLAYQEFLATTGGSVLDVDAARIDAYLSFRRDQGASPASLARAVAAIRGLHRFAADELGRVDPAAGLRAPRLASRLPKALPEAEVARLLDSVRGEDPPALRDRAILEVLYGTGMRVGELVGLDLSDLDPERQLVRVRGKGGRERLVPLAGAARAALLHWLGPRGRPLVASRRQRVRAAETHAVFLNLRGGRITRQGVWVMLSRRALEAGVSGGVHPHVLRHSCATHMLARGADIRVVQELLGHASVTTTQLYTKVTIEHLRQAYDAAHPRSQVGPAELG